MKWIELVTKAASYPFWRFPSGTDSLPSSYPAGGINRITHSGIYNRLVKMFYSERLIYGFDFYNKLCYLMLKLLC